LPVSDESVRRQVMGNGHEHSSRPPTRHLVELDRTQALELLAAVGYGRVVFTLGALPAIRPVNHLVDNGKIVIRTRLTAKLATVASPPDGTVVAYQADELDPIRRVGWSVVVTGIARPVTDATRLARYQQLLHPWVDQVTDTVIGIQPEIITGFRVTDLT
jgi:nitroimidazol reductase NimA-like FMN-containing flavoprotein (pyridoxamine 5'-phosphate oxidase superfamily)